MKHYAEKILRCGDTPVRYVEAGTGETLIFLHNGGGFWQSWIHQLDYFSQTHRVIALGWPGYEEGHPAEQPLSLAYYYDILRSFVVQMGLDRFALIGNCIGASIAIHYQTRHPDAVSALVLMNICPGRRIIRSRVMQALVYDIRHPGFRAWLTRVIRWTFTHSPARRIFPDIVFAGPRPTDDFLYGHFLANLVSPARTAGRLNLLFASDTFTLNRILTPQTDVRNSLLLWGARNKATPLRPHAAYHQRLCQIPELHVIPQGGHMAMYENPELVNDLIARHLASAGTHTPSTTPAP